MRRRKGVPQDVATKAALEVASVKAQAQAIVRRLQADLRELTYLVEELPEEDYRDRIMGGRGAEERSDSSHATSGIESGEA